MMSAIAASELYNNLSDFPSILMNAPGTYVISPF